MSNADMPAMPNSTNSCSIDAITNSSVTIEDMAQWNKGLTKREYFAARAPDEVPEWFKCESDTRPNAGEWQAAGRMESEYRKACHDWELRWRMDRLVAWRYAYADAMLAGGAQ